MFQFAWPALRSVFFRFDAEAAHEFAIASAAAFPRTLGHLVGRPPSSSETPTRIGPLVVHNPIGLAAGLDKNGLAVRFWPYLGFGFVEVGTVTAHPQPGNEKPRLFRLPAEKAIINRMGFNNEGSAALAVRLRSLRDAGHWPETPVGVNVGKSKITPLDDACDDYRTSISRLADVADWFTINVSSPNTPELRKLQSATYLAELLPTAVDAAHGTPVFLKLAPDLTDDEIGEAVQQAHKHGIAAIVATNTTVRRDLLDVDPQENGGLSGRPLWPWALDRIRHVLREAGNLPVVGVGGVATAEQAQTLLDEGCAAVQLYSALIYEGPALPRRIHRGLRTPAAARP